MTQNNAIKEFCKSAKFFMVSYASKGEEEFGKILTTSDMDKINLYKNEIHRSTEYKNGDMLFVFDLKPPEQGQYIDSPLQLLINNLVEARAIEMVYPGIFKWIFDGVSIKAYAIVPSGSTKSNTTITRYGGTENFMKILKKHLHNIGKMNRGQTPDYNFLNINDELKETELSIGSIHMFNKMFSVGIKLPMNYIDIIKNSKNNIQVWAPLNKLDMKYWAREINPDFITEAKHIKLKETLGLNGSFDLYPPCIKALMNMPHKGNKTRFLIARFLLAVHKPIDAKFIYNSVLSDDERKHIKGGNCSLQWTYILNNIQRYGCPTCRELKFFCDRIGCKLAHPLERIQEYLIREKEKNVDEE